MTRKRRAERVRQGRPTVASTQRSDEERLGDERYFGVAPPSLWLMEVWRAEIFEYVPDVPDASELWDLFVDQTRNRAETEELRGRRRQFLAEMRRDYSGFRTEHEQHWRNAFDLLDMLVFNTAELVAVIDKRLADGGHKDEPLPQVMMRLVWRAVLVSREIAWLLRGGFPEAGLGRWRTLHEVAVTASFMRKHGTEAAQRFLAHELLRTIDFNEARRREYGPEAFEDPDYDWEQEQKASLLARYGPSFAGHYGWAADVTKVKRPTFERIEAAAGLAGWRRAYEESTYPVHAASRSYHNELLQRHGEDVAWPTSNGIATPAIMTARSLQQVNCTVVALFTTSIEEAGEDLRTAVLLDLFARETMDEFAAHEWDAWELEHPGGPYAHPEDDGEAGTN